MLRVDQKLFGRLVVRVRRVAEHLAVADEEGHGHEDSVGPELPLSARRVGVPEASVVRARVRVERVPYTVCRELVFLLPRLLVKNEQQIPRQHVVRSEEHTSELQSLAYLVC